MELQRVLVVAMAGAVPTLVGCRGGDLAEPLPPVAISALAAEFAADDGSHRRFTGIFDALTPATVTPPRRPRTEIRGRP
ncbi:MAG: hypothetical protein OXI22_10095 [Defluviicoccus sp.]|nr:hypothetical protein [Defluviicoccus sp.]MDE0384225.1 hypothetical protein [Defluviicoccus sp.]